MTEKFYSKRKIQEILFKLFIHMQCSNKIQAGDTLRISFGIGMPEIKISVTKKQKANWEKHYWKYYQEELENPKWEIPF